MDGMGGTIIVIVIIGLSAALMIGFPLMNTANELDDVTKQVINTAVADLVNDICTTGIVSSEKLDKFTEKINSTGYAYVKEIKIGILDENEAKKLLQATQDKVGENDHYVLYTVQVEEALDKYGEMILNPGDTFAIAIYNPNVEISQQIERIFVPNNNDSSRQIASGYGTVY